MGYVLRDLRLNAQLLQTVLNLHDGLLAEHVTVSNNDADCCVVCRLLQTHDITFSLTSYCITCLCETRLVIKT